jgi:regulation of enolase protein 1 (concanavalin A-like superfamily)
MFKKFIFLVSFIMALSLLVIVQAAVVTFHNEQPTPGLYDVYNLVGATRDANNVGTTPYDSWLNDEWTYLALDRAAQGQTFVTGGSKPVYLLTGFWIQHVGYTENTASGTNNNGTWYSMPLNSKFGIRITDPAASGTVGFVLGSETYTVTRNEANILPAGVTSSANGTGTWIHFVLDTPIPVAANKTYGFDVVSITGNANMFFEILGIKDTSPNPPGNPYTAGTAYRSGANGMGNNVLTVAPGDRVFLVELVGAPPVKASIPNPADKEIAVSQDADLSWVPGFYAAKHDVYFGTDSDDVNNATVSTPQIYKGRQDANSFTLAALAPDTTYYWRIDEVREDGTTIDRGDIWSFTTEPSKAWDPSPYDNEICVFIDANPSLSWNSGHNSIQSQVYFGTRADSLELQTTITHTQGVEIYSHPIMGLVNDQDYYWRIDQIQTGNVTITGDIWHFRTIPIIPITDPTLVGWWKFDEGQGKAIDWSGLNQHGTVYGGAEYVAGYDVGAIDFDYVDDYVELPIGSTIASLNSTTIATWVSFPGTGETFQRIFNFGFNDATTYMFLTPNNGSGVPRFAITTTGSGGESGVDAPNALSSEWHHLAVTINGVSRGTELYIDGKSVVSGSTQALPSDLGNTTYNWLGRSDDWVPPNPYLIGSLDEFRIYNRALSQDEISKIMRGDPLLAWNPRPANKAITDVENTLPLSWSPGEKASKHDVYFGTDADAVENANISDNTGIYIGRQDANSYSPPGGVEPNQAYYWRIDELNTDSTISKGRTWSFNVAPYLIVDDFESYNDVDNRIYLTWEDYATNNTGMTVGHFVQPYAERSIVHNGSQSMYVRYDNDGTVNEGVVIDGFNYEQSGTLFYSEAQRQWTEPQDWTRKSAKALTLWFRGIPPTYGSFVAGPPTWTLTARGADIWGEADEFFFAYKQLSGNGAITARVDSITNTDPWAKAGVMIRETLEPGSVNFAMVVTPGNGVSFQRRISANAGSENTTQAGITAPQWVRLTRSGNTFIAEYSATGTANSWTQLGSVETPMAADVYIGLCLTSHNVNATCTAEFSNITLPPSVTGQWQLHDIGIQSNDPEQLYIVLQDSTGSSSPAVKYSDAAATTIDTWTQWDIPLPAFTGVNLQSITKLFIGVGDRASTQPGGAGDLYIDDIGLLLP